MSLGLSIIISTYNRPEALNLVLQNICLQMDDDSEVIVADDGSTAETARVIEHVKQRFPNCNIHHVWQVDEGFRLARIRNLAVNQAKGEYLIFLDGDCIPSSNFLKKHKILREPGWLVYGQRILIGNRLTDKLETSVKRGEVISLDLLRLILSKIKCDINRIAPILYWPFDLFRKRCPEDWNSIRGCNWAMWKNDYISVNGSDETFQGWGSEDKDLAVRLLNSGIKIKNGKFGPYVLHLWHEQEDKEKDSEKNKLVSFRRKNRIIKPTKGMLEK